MKNIKAIYQLLILTFVIPILTCFLYAPLAILCLIFKQYKSAGNVVNFWGKNMLWILAQKYSIEGIENIDLTKRYIIISNHGSAIDILLNAAIINNPVSWVMKSELLKLPVVNWMFMLGVGIPISRSNARGSQDKMLNTIQNLRNTMNPNIIIYPEGTRTKTKELNAFKRGFVQVMRNYEIDILPITLSGVVNFYSSTQKFPNPNSIMKIIVHPVESFNKLKEFTDKEIAQNMQNIIASKYYA